jgi:hypothetical protein
MNGLLSWPASSSSLSFSSSRLGGGPPIAGLRSACLTAWSTHQDRENASEADCRI